MRAIKYAHTPFPNAFDLLFLEEQMPFSLVVKALSVLDAAFFGD
jgi:hypothetical protein